MFLHPGSFINMGDSRFRLHAKKGKTMERIIPEAEIQKWIERYATPQPSSG
jgi:hypothetical protein